MTTFRHADGEKYTANPQERRAYKDGHKAGLRGVYHTDADPPMSMTPTARAAYDRGYDDGRMAQQDQAYNAGYDAGFKGEQFKTGERVSSPPRAPYDRGHADGCTARLSEERQK